VAVYFTVPLAAAAAAALAAVLLHELRRLPRKNATATTTGRA
jgi:hypothetical protein